MNLQRNKLPPSLTARRRKEIKSLGQRKHRNQQREMLIEGLRSVVAAIEADAPLVEILSTPETAEKPKVHTLLKQTEVPVHIVPASELSRLSTVQTDQGLLAVARMQTFPFEQLLTLRTILALDGVQDPGNVGTILRTAAWFGIEAVLGGPGTADFFSPKVVRSAMGGLWDVHLTRSQNLSNSLTFLRAEGWTLYGADLEGQPLQHWQPDSPGVLVLGSEAHGLSAPVKAVLAACIAIPSAPNRQGTESLNVAVAAGILAHAWLGHLPLQP